MDVPSNQNVKHLPMFVVDVLRYDIEQVPAITNLLNNSGTIGWRKYWPHDFTNTEVSGALGRLVTEALVRVLVFDPQRRELVASKSVPIFEGALEEYWFQLSDAGRKRWEEWEPPAELDSPAGSGD